MQTVSPTLPEQNSAVPARTSSVVMGRQDYISVLLRLTAMELYKIRRRLMSKTLIGFGLLAMIGIFSLLALFTWSDVNRPASSFSPPLCSQVVTENCSKQQPTQAQLEQYKHNRIVRDSYNLSLPKSLNNAGTMLLIFLTVLIIVLIGSIVGGEYSLGTARLMFTRGPTRLQFLISKIVVAIVCTVIAVLILTLVGILTGLVLNPISGIAPSYSFYNAAWLGHASLYVLLIMLTWFVYAIVALFFGTVGRSTVAGIVGALVWLFVEPILARIILLVTISTSGSLHDFLKAIPDYFISSNVGALTDNQAHILFGSDPSTLSDGHALSVLAVYLVVFIAISCIVTVRRDVTN